MKKLVIAFVLLVSLIVGLGYSVHYNRDHLVIDSAAQTEKMHRNIELHLP